MRVALVARDAAPSRAFMRLAKELQSRRHEVYFFVGDGKPLDATLDGVRAGVKAADVAVIGMSSSLALAEPELAACEAASQAGKPYGFYLDTANCHNREWFGDFRNKAGFFFAINEREAKKVHESYPQARVVATGNPLREDAFFPKFTRAQVREKLGVAEDETLVLAPGGKSPVVNIQVWGAVLDALTRFGERKWRVVLALHPGDRTPFAVDPDVVKKLAAENIKGMMPAMDVFNIFLSDAAAQIRIYNDLVKFAPPKLTVSLLGKDAMATDDMVAGADLIVEHGSSIGVFAASQRKPVVTVNTVTGVERLFAASKTRRTELADLCISKESISGAGELAYAIDLVLTESGFALYRANQEEEYPQPAAQGAAVKQMADALESLL